MIDKVLVSTRCSRNIAIAWSMNAKNTLSNIYGFSPHFLVFGRNPMIPDVLNTENVTSLNSLTSSKVVAEHLNAMCEARKTFVELQNSDKLKRAFRERIHPSSTQKFVPGDEVYWKREGENFKGPATVVGQLNNQVLIWNFGRVVKINPNRVKLVLKDDVTNQSAGVRTDKEPVLEQGPRIPAKTAKMAVRETPSEEDCMCTANNVDKDPVDQWIGGDKDPDDREAEREADKDREADKELTVAEDKEPVVSDLNGRNAGVGGSHSQDKVDAQLVSQSQLDLDSLKTRNNTYVRKMAVSKQSKDQETKAKEEKAFFSSDEETMYLIKVPDSIEVKNAKATELNRFKEFGVYKEEKDRGQFAVSSRWVISQKGNKIKARLVARGFEELKSNVSDAPTAAVASKRIFLMLTASFGWKLETVDITAAFLQADAIMRDVYIRPPADVRKTGVLWRLCKPMYGLEDSSRQWYLTLRDTLLELKCNMSKLDKSVFSYYHDNKLQGLLVTHVDDIIYSGTGKFKNNVIKKLTEKFKISRLASGIFEYLGWNIKQESDHILVDQRLYAEKVKAVQLTSSRKIQLDEDLSTEEVKSYQKLLGQLLWLSCQTRLDLMFDTMEHSTYNKKPTVRNLISLNKVVKKLPDGPKHLRFNQIDIKREGLKIVFYADASLGNLGKDKTDSGRGYVIFLVNDVGTCGVIDYSANKVRRKVHSILGAETIAFQDAMSAAIYVRALISEIIYRDIDSHIINLVGVTDSRQLVESTKSTKQCSEHRLRMDMAVIQESLNTGDVQMKWTATQEQLSDCLTKNSADNKPLCEAVETGDISRFVI